MAGPKTYSCVVGTRIVELTGEQRAAIEWRRADPETRIEILLARIEQLEAEVASLKAVKHG